jgi:two-component system sensor histidine kinase HydH
MVTDMSRYLSWIRTSDLVWLLIFGAMEILGPAPDSAKTEVIVVMFSFQVLSTRLPFFLTPSGLYLTVGLKLLLGYLLIGVTGGIESSYYPILFWPIISAATTLGSLGAVVCTLLTIAGYLSQLLWLDWNRYELLDAAVSEISLRAIFLGLVAYLTHELARHNRQEARNYQAVAEQLAAANANLQKAEEAMRRTERLAALGQLTAGLAHELRNPIGTIKNSAELLSKRLPAEDELSRELSGFIQSEVDRTNSLITRFLQFARPFHLQRSRQDIAQVLDRSIVHVERQFPGFPITFVKNYAPNVPAVDLDQELIEQVFINLLVNAAQASPPGSVVTVKTRADERQLEVAVIDRGAGIDPAIQGSIFNPFFTTKKDGVGLGLAIVAKIIDEHGGRIVVESEVGQGSVFRVLLPLS